MPDEPTPETTTPPVETAPAAVTPPVEAPPQPGPWSADAVEYFGDNQEAIASFDRYMREKQQPRITELEGHPGRTLHADLSGDDTRDATMAEIIEELYGPERAQQFFADQAVAEPDPQPNDPPAWAKPLLDDHQATQAAKAAKAAADDYDSQLASMREKHKDLRDEDMELIHPFIAIATDTDEAVAAYRKFTDSFKAAHGITPAEAAADETPPAVLGTTGAAAATPPVEVKYKSIDEATEAFFAENRKQAPPAVL